MAVQEFKSPTRKLMEFFRRSRDGWKAKHHKLKYEYKKQATQVRAVEKSREHWRERARELARELKGLKNSVDAI